MNQRTSKRFLNFIMSGYAEVIYAGITCLVLAILCIMLAQYSTYASIWVVNAVLLIFIFRSDPSLRWYLYFIGLCANWVANIFAGAPIILALAIALSNSMEILIPMLFVPYKPTETFFSKGLDHQTAMLAFSVTISCIAAAGLTTTLAVPTWTSKDFLLMTFNWFTIDLLAMMAVLPLGLCINADRIHKLFKTSKLVELGIVAATAMILTWLSTKYPDIRFVIILMPLLYAAFRFGIVGTSAICFMIVGVYITSIILGTFTNTRFANTSQWISYSYLLMCITILPALVIAILIEQRDEFEQKLGEDEQRFRGAIKYSAIGMSLISPEGKWMIVNPALCEITGYTEDELMKLTFQDITHPDDLQKDIDLLQQLTHNQISSYNLEKRYINKSGDIVWVSLVVSAVFDQKNRVLYFISQIENITTRKRMETALQESEHRWNFALEGGNQGVWDWNITENKIYFSRTWKVILGFQDHEISGSLNEWFSRIHPDDREKTMFELNQHIAGRNDGFHCEHRIRCKDNSYKWFLGRGKVIARSISGTGTRVIGTITDIDAIKKSEAETEQLSQRLQMALDSGKVGIFNYDIQKDVLDWDDRMFELYRTPPSQFTHNFEAWKSCVHPDDLPDTLRRFRESVDQMKNFDAEFRLLFPDTGICWIRAKAQVLRDKNGKPASMLGMNWDITSEKQLIHDLYTEKERLSTTLKAIGDAVIVSDAHGIISFINPIAEQLVGCSAHYAVGKNLYEICKIISENTGELLESPIDACLSRRSSLYVKQEGILINHVGARFYIQDSAAPIILPSGEIAGCVLVMQDVTLNRNLQTELKHQATHDVLTGLINRREIELKIKSLISDTRKQKNVNSLFFVDMDNFKIVNDTAGHAAGDELLRRIAEILTNCVRNSDTVARLGGDEFAILLPECSTEDATLIAKKIIDQVKHYIFVWNEKSYSIGVSIGLVTFRTNEMTLEAVLSQADIACYTAKNLGGDRVSIFEGTDSDASRYLSEIQLAPRLQKAVQENAFLLYAQQVVPLHNDPHLRPYYEVLIRMQDENGNLILPSLFMKTAERQNLIIDIDKWVLEKVLIGEAKNILACGQFELSINISAASIHSPDFHQALDKLLNETKLDKTKIGFELKEAAFQNNVETAQALLTLLEKHGCFICLDNFGQGLHSFQYFKNFSDIYIKIDGDYVRDINNNPISYAIVDSINQLGHKLGAKTIATIAESENVLKSARKIGIDYAQGYAVSKVISLSELLNTLKNHTPQG